MSRGRRHRHHQRPESMPFTDDLVYAAVVAFDAEGEPATAQEIATRVRKQFPRSSGAPVTHNDITAVLRCLSSLMTAEKVFVPGERPTTMGRRPRVFAPCRPG